MPVSEEIRKNRIKKRQKLEHLGFSPYPISIKRTHQISQVLSNFNKIKKQEVILVGRIRTMRSHGSLTFFDFEDGTGRIQALFAKDKIGEKNYQFFLEYFDIGDFIEVKGFLFKTKRGEETIEGKDFK